MLLMPDELIPVRKKQEYLVHVMKVDHTVVEATDNSQ